MSNTSSSVCAIELERWMDTLLDSHSISDYCPNGRQLAGKPKVGKIVSGVTASLALLEAAIEHQADAILVHHGWFWKNEDPRLIGSKGKRAALALKHGINIYGYHLPLDMHPSLGNNAQLAQIMGWEAKRDANKQPLTCGPNDLIWLGHCGQNKTLKQLQDDIANILKRQPLVIGNADQTLDTIAWCTGAAQGMMQDAIDAGAQAFITGEASEPNYHLANETGTAFIAAGHHATERYGVKALGEAVAQHFGIETVFIDLDNPI